MNSNEQDLYDQILQNLCYSSYDDGELEEMQRNITKLQEVIAELVVILYKSKNMTLNEIDSIFDLDYKVKKRLFKKEGK